MNQCGGRSALILLQTRVAAKGGGGRATAQKTARTQHALTLNQKKTRAPNLKHANARTQPQDFANAGFDKDELRDLKGNLAAWQKAFDAEGLEFDEEGALAEALEPLIEAAPEPSDDDSDEDDSEDEDEDSSD